MSLFIGNLPTRTRRDALVFDLQRMFRSFGTCTIRLKEKYGFVDYDYPASAEKALKSLQGTIICGEPLNISWATGKQTVPQSFIGGKPYEPPLQNFYTVSQYPELRVDPTNRQEYETAPKKLSSSILVNKSNCYDPNIHDRKYHPEDKRWGERVVDPTNVKYPENIVFDRYEPHERRRVSPMVGSREIKLSPSCRLRSRESEKEPSISRKRKKRDYERQDINHLKGANKGPSPSLVHSDYTLSSSKSRSKASRAVSRSPSLSKSKSISRSSSPLPSESKSSHSGTKTSSSRSTSRSKSPSRSESPSRSKSPSRSESPSRSKSPSRSESPSRSKSPNSSLLPVEQDSMDNVDNAVSVDPSKNPFEEETLAKSGAGTFKPENIAPAVETEIETKPADSEPEDMEKDLSENGHIIDDVGLQSVEETKDSEKEVFLEEHVPGLKSDVSLKSNASKSTKMSSEEMYVVLKHYGLQLPDDQEKDLPVETYFGSARLWPWEMVYYRRLKKGSITTGNYSRRVAQNQEFGIVDKFIRSSSGWGEN